jgi:hypothetical protein
MLVASALKPNHDVKQKLGFPDVQPFASAMRDAVTKVASTAYGENDCGERASDSPWAPSMIAHIIIDRSRTYFGFARPADLNGDFLRLLDPVDRFSRHTLEPIN